MKIVSFNVNGLRAILQKNFINDFHSFDADIFSLNETKLSDVKEKFNFTPEGYNIYYTSFNNRFNIVSEQQYNEGRSDCRRGRYGA